MQTILSARKKMVSHDRREDNAKQKNTRWLLRSGNFILPEF